MNKQPDNNLDKDGYRRNVGIIVCNQDAKVLWARRVHRDGWQFPQGGIEPLESPKQAAFRELREEVGLRPDDVKLLGSTVKWLRYEPPYLKRYAFRRRIRSNEFRGQKQLWFLFQLISEEHNVCLDISDKPEFDRYQWVDYWTPVNRIVPFKRRVYQQALLELEPIYTDNFGLTPKQHRPRPQKRLRQNSN